MAGYERKFVTPRQAGLDQVVEVWEALTTTEETDPENKTLISRLQEKGILPGTNGELDDDGVDRVASILAAMELMDRARNLLWLAIGPLEIPVIGIEEIQRANKRYKFTEVEIYSRSSNGMDESKATKARKRSTSRRG